MMPALGAGLGSRNGRIAALSELTVLLEDVDEAGTAPRITTWPTSGIESNAI